MLLNLAIRDVVLIDRLEIAFAPGLSVLTGETGAGKSILLDALGLALGARADSLLVRHGAQQAVVGAAFETADDHPARILLAEQGVDVAGDFVLRRLLGSDGRSRAFINDQPVSVGLLRQVGELLVEIAGQFEQRGLLDAATHRRLLDLSGALAAQQAAVGAAWRDWRGRIAAHEEAAAAVGRARREEDFLRHAVAELDAMAPQSGEESALAETRGLLMHGGKIMEALQAALGELAGERGAETALGAAQRHLDRIAGRAGAALDPAIAALDRAAAETAEAAQQLRSLGSDLDLDPRRLEQIEERLFALRTLARKHNVAVEDLPALAERFAASLAALDDQSGRLARLADEAAAARQGYVRAAEALTGARRKAAKALDAAVNAELAPLKLDKAQFRTVVEILLESQWGETGSDRVTFEASTNPGTPPGPIARIASGGELARFMLALKVALAAAEPVPTLVFDEVDSGVGGATAAAVGERLSRLARDVQVLVVTHSPQVAARANHHWRVEKVAAGDAARTSVAALDAAGQREEIARMLSGATVSDEARAAATRLMTAGARR